MNIDTSLTENMLKDLLETLLKDLNLFLRGSLWVALHLLPKIWNKELNMNKLRCKRFKNEIFNLLTEFSNKPIKLQLICFNNNKSNKCPPSHNTYNKAYLWVKMLLQLHSQWICARILLLLLTWWVNNNLVMVMVEDTMRILTSTK